jgi:DNA-directed RNA polymerase alpha subunit
MHIDELGLRISISSALKDIRIFYVEDLCEANEDELLRHESIGVRTTARLRDVLQQANLSFREPVADAERIKSIVPSASSGPGG